MASRDPVTTAEKQFWHPLLLYKGWVVVLGKAFQMCTSSITGRRDWDARRPHSMLMTRLGINPTKIGTSSPVISTSNAQCRQPRLLHKGSVAVLGKALSESAQTASQDA